jgi:hypothetical protein
MLIKNMLDNRANGWEKTKKQDESGPMKVDELREKLEKKLREEMAERDRAEQEEQSYLGGGGSRKGDSYKRTVTYQEKGSSGRGAGKPYRDDRRDERRDDRRVDRRGDKQHGGKYEKQNTQSY